MVTENGVWAVADQLRARGKPRGGTKERVSVRNVRKKLGDGSHEDIGHLLARCNARLDYEPMMIKPRLPLTARAALTRDI